MLNFQFTVKLFYNSQTDWLPLPNLKWFLGPRHGHSSLHQWAEVQWRQGSYAHKDAQDRPACKGYDQWPSPRDDAPGPPVLGTSEGARSG